MDYKLTIEDCPWRNGGRYFAALGRGQVIHAAVVHWRMVAVAITVDSR
jgi:hypothetical protein